MSDHLKHERAALHDWDKRLENGPPDDDAATLAEIDRIARRILIVGIVFVLLGVAGLIWACVASASPNAPSGLIFQGEKTLAEGTRNDDRTTRSRQDAYGV